MSKGKTNNIIKRIVDTAMTVLLLFLMAYQITGERGSLHDYRAGHKDHESRGTENRHGVEAICPVYSFCYDIFIRMRDRCEPDRVIPGNTHARGKATEAVGKMKTKMGK